MSYQRVLLTIPPHLGWGPGIVGPRTNDSGAQILMCRFCHRYDNEDRMLECLWSCVDERDVFLPPGRSWCRKPSDPPHTHPFRLLCQMPVSRAGQEVLNTSSRLPSHDLRNASSGRQGLAGHAAVQSIKCDVGADWPASNWHDQSIWAGAAWLNVPCCECWLCIASRCEGPCATSEDREFSAVT